MNVLYFHLFHCVVSLMILTSGKTSKATVLKSLVNNKSKRQKREKQKVYLTLIPPVGTEAHTHTLLSVK